MAGLASLGLGLQLAFASDPASGTVSKLGQTVTWTGFIPAGANDGGPGACNFEGPANNCDRFILTVEGPLDGSREVILITLDGFGANDLDLAILNQSGQQVGGSGNFPGNPEAASFPAEPGVYEVIAIGFAAVAASYNGSATVKEGPGVRQVNYVQGGILFSPDVTPQAPELPRGGEPSARIDRDGFLYAGGIRGLSSGGVDIWRWDTKNDPCLQNPKYLGQPIEIDEAQLGGPGGGDLEIAVSQPDDPNGVPVVTAASLLLLSVPIAISFDRGETWERHELGDQVITGAQATDRHWITAYGNNTVYLSGRGLASATLSDLWVSTSIDHGRTWSPRDFVQIAASTTPGYLDVDRRPLGSAPGAGNVYYSHQNANAMFVSVAEPSPIPGVSPTGGPLSFRTYVVDNTTGHGHLFDVVRVGVDGTLYAVWSDDRDIYLATSTDQARTWSTPVRVNNPNTVDANGRQVRTNIFPWLVPGDRGRVGIVWFGSNAFNNGDNEGDWAVYYTFSENALDDIPTFTQVQASDHYIHAFNVSEAGLGSGAANNRNLLDFFQVDMDPTGAAVIAFADDHNDFQGQTFVTRQISGPSLLASVGTLAGDTCGSTPHDQNPLRASSDPEVVDFRNDAQVLRRTTIQTDVPFDIVGIDYSDDFSEAGARQLKVAIQVSLMTNPPPDGFHWLAYFSANARDDLFDRGQSFFVEASTDPVDNASSSAPVFFYGTVTRRGDGGFDHTRSGLADEGFFDPANNQVVIKLGLDAVNEIAEPDIGVGSRLIGLRGLTFLGSFEVTLPVLGPTNGSDLERDFTRGGIAYVIGTEEPRQELECDDPAITRFGGWHEVEDERAGGGHYCRNVGGKDGKPYLSFSFSGTSVEVIYATGPRGGNAEVFIDGDSHGTLSFHRPPSDPAHPDNSGKQDLTFGVSTRYNTDPGTHTFRLAVTNTEAGSQNPPANMAYVDGFVIQGGSRGQGDPTESSSVTHSSLLAGASVLETVEATPSTTLLTGILEAPADAEMDLLILDPLGGVAGTSGGPGPHAVSVSPSVPGSFIMKVVNRSIEPGDYSLYQVVTSTGPSPDRAQDQPENQLEAEPLTFSLSQNYPNPFNPETEIRYVLSTDAFVTLKVYDILGRQVAVLVRDELRAGPHSVRFDASGIPSGTYYYRIDVIDSKGDHSTKTMNLTVIK